jgi:MoaA/NifB/PqqE/SkfB family radical SAM enzyme
MYPWRGPAGSSEIVNSAFKYLHHKFVNSPDRWHPFLAVYYLTYKCDFRCPYCSDGSGRPYYEMPDDILPARDVIEVLTRIRRLCDYIVITGGEPLKHPEFSEVMREVIGLRFRDIALNTNGYEADLFLPEISQAVTSLIFSLDTLIPDKADAWFGRGKGVFDKVKSNILLAARNVQGKQRIIISSVVTPGNIPDLYDVYDFAQTHGFMYAACPALRGVKPPGELRGNWEYEAFFDFLIVEKKKGRLIHGSTLCLRFMRDFAKFKCRPFTMLVVDPLGRISYPCLEIGHGAGNILENDNLHAIRINGLKRFGPQPECGTQCHSACALGFALILDHPFSMVEEVLLSVKGVLAPKGAGG